MQTKIIHLSSAHQRYDIRIFIKMCCTLAKIPEYSVALVVADGKGNEVKSGVQICDVGMSSGRLNRMLKATKKIYQKAKELDADIYHLHDPELIPVGLRLKKLGKRVVFDAHEDFPKQLLGKPYLNRPTKILLSKFFELYEKWTLKKFDYIITATPYIRDKFLQINPHSVDINNFPILGELSNSIPWSGKKDEICYVGGIANIRGIKELVKSLEFTDNARLSLVGQFSEKDVEEEVKSYRSWEKVNELGFLGRSRVSEIMSQSKVGMVTFHPLPNHINAQPNKMFEYMSAGLPIVTSNFTLWKEIVEGNNCGICVNPLEPREIAKAINYMIFNPEQAEQMGKNGKQAVIEKYNWAIEEKKLLNVYRELSQI